MTMQLTEQAVREFQELYLREYGAKISREQAMDLGMKLVDLVSIVYEKRTVRTLDDGRKEAYDKNGDNRIL